MFCNDIPRLGERRTRRRFCWFPFRSGSQSVWLRWIVVDEEFLPLASTFPFEPLGTFAVCDWVVQRWRPETEVAWRIYEL